VWDGQALNVVHGKILAPTGQLTDSLYTHLTVVRGEKSAYIWQVSWKAGPPSIPPTCALFG
jgi:hypothetical protein